MNVYPLTGAGNAGRMACGLSESCVHIATGIMCTVAATRARHALGIVRLIAGKAIAISCRRSEWGPRRQNWERDGEA